MKKLIAFALPLLVLIPAAQANAHAELVGAFPKANARVSQAINIVRLTFDDNLIELSDANKIVVTDSKKQRVDLGNLAITGNRVTIGLKKLKIGKYRISYRVLSADGHPVESSYFFSVSK